MLSPKDIKEIVLRSRTTVFYWSTDSPEKNPTPLEVVRFVISERFGYLWLAYLGWEYHTEKTVSSEGHLTSARTHLTCYDGECSDLYATHADALQSMEKCYRDKLQAIQKDSQKLKEKK